MVVEATVWRTIGFVDDNGQSSAVRGSVPLDPRATGPPKLLAQLPSTLQIIIGLFSGPRHAETQNARSLERHAIHNWGETVSDLLTFSDKVLFPLNLRRKSGERSPYQFAQLYFLHLENFILSNAYLNMNDINTVTQYIGISQRPINDLPRTS